MSDTANRQGKARAGVFISPLFIPVLLTAFGLLLLGLSWRDLDYVDATSGPAAGFFPTLVGAGLTGLGLVGVVSALRSRSGPPRTEPVRRPAKLLGLLGLCVVTVWSMPALGAGLAFALFMFVEMKVIEDKPWLRTVIASIAVPLAAYLLFEIGLQVQLPGGLVFGYRLEW